MAKVVCISILFVAAVGVLSACGGGGMRGMSDQELAAKNDECVRVNPTSPGKVTACENIRKECARRREAGNYAC